MGAGGRGLRRGRGRQRRRRAVEGDRERLRRHRPGRDAARPGRLPGSHAAARGGPVDADPDAHRDGRRPGPRRGPGQRSGRLPAQAVLLPGAARAPALADPPHARRPAGGAGRGGPEAGSGQPHRHPRRRSARPDQPGGRGAGVPPAAQGTRGVQDRAARALLGRQLRRRRRPSSRFSCTGCGARSSGPGGRRRSRPCAARVTLSGTRHDRGRRPGERAAPGLAAPGTPGRSRHGARPGHRGGRPGAHRGGSAGAGGDVPAAAELCRQHDTRPAAHLRHPDRAVCGQLASDPDAAPFGPRPDRPGAGPRAGRHRAGRLPAEPGRPARALHARAGLGHAGPAAGRGPRRAAQRSVRLRRARHAPAASRSPSSPSPAPTCAARSTRRSPGC